MFRVGLRLRRSRSRPRRTKSSMPQHEKFRRSAHPKEKRIIVASLLFVSVSVLNQNIQKNENSHVAQKTIESPANSNAAGVTPEQALSLQVPFRAGEVLNYRLTWSVFLNAASIQLSVVEQRDLFGTPTWHFRAGAHSQAPLRALAVVDDQFDSYAETASLESRQYETYLDELGDKQDAILQLVSMNTPRKNRARTVLVKPHTRDPLAALYLLRTVDWQKTPEFHAPVYDGEDLYEMSARMESGAEVISVSGHEMKATKVAVRLFRAGQQSRTKCSVWFSQDQARIPVLIEAEVPYGSVRAELVSKTP